MKTSPHAARALPAALFFAAALAVSPAPRAFAQPTISIIVDGLPLDAKAVTVKDEVYVPAWILENYAHTKINWMRQSNVLEILTSEPSAPAPPAAGVLKIKVGFYLDSEGFVLGRNTRLFLLNVDPKEFRFPDGKTPAGRAHEGAIDRIGSSSEAVRDYLTLSPTERFSSKGWKIVARMPKDEIASLPALVDKYESLFKSLYYDLLTNLVIEREQEVNTSSVIDDSLKGIRIERIPVSDEGAGEVKIPNGVYFLYARMLYRNRQVVWDVPLSVRGNESLIELSNRNAALMQ